MSVLSKPYLHNEEAAFAQLEGILWPEGPVCRHCASKRATQLQGKSTRLGTIKCNDCRKQFTDKVGTVFESAQNE